MGKLEEGRDAGPWHAVSPHARNAAGIDLQETESMETGRAGTAAAAPENLLIGVRFTGPPTLGGKRLPMAVG